MHTHTHTHNVHRNWWLDESRQHCWHRGIFLFFWAVRVLRWGEGPPSAPSPRKIKDGRTFFETPFRRWGLYLFPWIWAALPLLDQHSSRMNMLLVKPHQCHTWVYVPEKLPNVCTGSCAQGRLYLQKQPTLLSTEEWIHNLWYTHASDCST